MSEIREIRHQRHALIQQLSDAHATSDAISSAEEHNAFAAHIAQLHAEKATVEAALFAAQRRR